MASILESEIREQPAALERLLKTQSGRAREAGHLLARHDIRFIVIAARGSSGNAARYAQYVLGRAHRVPVALATPSLYTIYGQPPRLDGALVLAISQSGSSPDIVSVLEEGRRQGRPTIALTNTPGSAVAAAADVVLPLEAGEERSVAASKTYSNSIGAIALLFSVFTEDKVAADELHRMPEFVASQIDLSLREVDGLALNDARSAAIIGRGVTYTTAHEIALKIRELSGILVEAWSPADLRHGPIAALVTGSPVIGVAPPGPAQASVLEMLAELRGRGANTIAIAEDRPPVDDVLRIVGDVPEWLSPLTAVVPGQVAALRVAELRGLDVDRPAGLQKVTLTR
jgi:glucosamine--fructose-6-phosphate aminotransferase (isomerizing)